ncbi:sigma-70 family RNA polymerase sigma factor [Clostridium sp.]|uniref:sigma-70 family RNA polymerase sigma factor n=1 Tax=Clostridium sp. TaxID=1506 RepID=UPI0025B917BF|nr:sigma-70 family RNA polymerase sigma factor [Clostridium sp.]
MDKNIDEIYEKYFNRVFFYVKRILKDVGTNEDIEDCVSDVFLALWKDSDKYNISRGSYDTFVNVKTRSIALNYRKKLISKKIKVEEFDCNSITDKEILITENYVIDKFEKQRIIQEIERFKEPNRSYFYLKYFMNYEVKDIAKMFNTTASAVENRLYRCRLKLKKILKKEVI